MDTYVVTLIERIGKRYIIMAENKSEALRRVTKEAEGDYLGEKYLGDEDPEVEEYKEENY